MLYLILLYIPWTLLNFLDWYQNQRIDIDSLIAGLKVRLLSILSFLINYKTATFLLLFIFSCTGHFPYKHCFLWVIGIRTHKVCFNHCPDKTKRNKNKVFKFSFRTVNGMVWWTNWWARRRTWFCLLWRSTQNESRSSTSPCPSSSPASQLLSLKERESFRQLLF